MGKAAGGDVVLPAGAYQSASGRRAEQPARQRRGDRSVPDWDAGGFVLSVDPGAVDWRSRGWTAPRVHTSGPAEQWAFCAGGGGQALDGVRVLNSKFGGN